MKYAYLDSGVWIIRGEGIPAYRSKVSDELRKLENDGWQFCLSDLVTLEVLIKPFRKNQQSLIGFYNQLFSAAINFSSYSLIFQDALEKANINSLKALDATHVAIAVKYHCDLFVTTDPDYRNFKSLPLHFIDLSKTAIP